MLFNSLEFGFFFPIVVAIYFLLAQRLQPIHVPNATASSIFPTYILTLALTVIVAGIWRGRRPRQLLPFTASEQDESAGFLSQLAYRLASETAY